MNYGINHYSTPTQTRWKASFAERVIRTIKSRLQKYFVQNKTKKWIDVIRNVVADYNATPHSAHGLPPQDVTAKNRNDVYKKLYPNIGLKTVCKLQVGDRVRKIIEKTLFEKGYQANWSEEIYVIDQQFQSNLVCWYKIKSLNGEIVPGIWYYYQLNLVARNDNQSDGKTTK